jgi:dTMP kinase
MFIVVEGPEGAGKSSLVKWLTARLAATGHRVVAVREPGGTPVAEAARELALRTHGELSPAAELFLMLAARADLVDRVIRPALAQGAIVLAVRYGLSTIAYQVAGRGLPRRDVLVAHGLATGGLEPDLTLVLDVPVTVGRARQRADGKGQDRFEREDDAFHERVRDAYATAAGPGVVHLDASPPAGIVQEAAWRQVAAVTAPSARGVS